MSTSSLPNVLDGLCDGLQARADLATVSVWSAHPGELVGENVVLALGPVVVTEDALGIGEDDRLETYSIPCGIWIAKAAPNVEDAIRETRDRVHELFGFVETYLNLSTPQTISSTCLDAQIQGFKLTQGPYAGSDFNGRQAQIDFDIEVQAQKAP